jgi:hypothetical protein
LVACLEVIVSDHGGKRPRRSRRTITRVPRQSRPVVIVKVIREAALWPARLHTGTLTIRTAC